MRGLVIAWSIVLLIPNIASAQSCEIVSAEAVEHGYWHEWYGYEITGYSLRGLDSSGGIVWEVDLGMNRTDAATYVEESGQVYALLAAGEVRVFRCDGRFLFEGDLDLSPSGLLHQGDLVGSFDLYHRVLNVYGRGDSSGIEAVRWDVPFTAWDPAAPPAGHDEARLVWATGLDGEEGPFEADSVRGISLTDSGNPCLTTAVYDPYWCGDPRRCSAYYGWEDFEFDAHTGLVIGEVFGGSMELAFDGHGVVGVSSTSEELFRRDFGQPVVLAERSRSHRGWAGVVVLDAGPDGGAPAVHVLDEFGASTESLVLDEGSRLVRFDRASALRWTCGAEYVSHHFIDALVVGYSPETGNSQYCNLSIATAEIGGLGSVEGEALPGPGPISIVPVRQVEPAADPWGATRTGAPLIEGRYYECGLEDPVWWVRQGWWSPGARFEPAGPLRWTRWSPEQNRMDARWESGVHQRFRYLFDQGSSQQLETGMLVLGYPTHDIDASDIVDEADLDLIRHHLLGDQLISDERGLASADVDYDGEIAIDDAIAIEIVSAGDDPDPEAIDPEPEWSLVGFEGVGGQYVVILSLEFEPRAFVGMDLTIEPIGSNSPVLGLGTPFEPAKTLTHASEVGRVVSTGATPGHVTVSFGADPITGLSPAGIRVTGYYAGPRSEKREFMPVEFPVDQIVKIQDGQSPPTRVDRTTLHPVSPNPFNPRTTIRFDLAHAGPAKLVVCDARGRLVATLVSERKSAGGYSEEWDGLDQQDRPVSSGVYWARLEADGRAFTQKMVLVR